MQGSLSVRTIPPRMTAIRLGKRTGVARYHQVYTLLLRSLADGTIAAGSALPSELELMRRFQVSRNTIRHALARLEREKRIVRRRGSGTFARQTVSPASTGRGAMVGDDLHDGHASGSGRILQFGKTQTPGMVKDRWPGFGPESLLIQRAWTLNDQVLGISTFFIETGAARGLSRAALSGVSVFEPLMAAGRTPGRASQTCRAQAADAIVAQQLGIMPGTPVMLVTRWISDGADQPLLLQQITYRGDLYELQLELEAAGGDSLRWQIASTAG